LKVAAKPEVVCGVSVFEVIAAWLLCKARPGKVLFYLSPEVSVYSHYYPILSKRIARI
jgi:hypothetical protein